MMRNLRKTFALFAIGLLLLIQGCGGGSAGTDATPTPSPTSSPLPTTSLRLLQPGDSWTYSLTTIGPSTNLSGTSTQVVTLSSDTLSGQNVLSQLTITYFSTAALSSLRYFRQDATTRDLSYAAEQNRQLYAQPVFALPGVWSREFTTASYRSNGLGTITETFDVDGTETVSVPAGTFQTWRVRQSQRTEDAETTGTYWYAPEVGALVKADYTTRYTLGGQRGQSYVYRTQLTSWRALGQ